MAAPVLKGFLITASVLVAVGVAVLENEQLREWILESRRKLAQALHSLGDEIHPSSRSRSGSLSDSDDEAAFESQKKRREEIIRLNRLELIRQARAEGVSVDLDELVRLGTDLDTPLPEHFAPPPEAIRSTSFDRLLNPDGTLKKNGPMAQTSGTDATLAGLRHRGAGARGLEAGLRSNPFDDESAVLFDRELIGMESVHSEKSPKKSPTPTSLAESQYYSEDEMSAQVEEAIRRSLEGNPTNRHSEPKSLLDASITEPSDSSSASDEPEYYYAPPPQSHQPPQNQNASMYSSAMETMLAAHLYDPLPNQDSESEFDGEMEANTPTGVLTPTEDGFSTVASQVDSQTDDVARLSDVQSMLDESEADAKSEASEGFSLVGAETPGSWTDVESEAGEEGEYQVQTSATQVLTER